jgi:prolyl-tRNA editing enzyme YbaK/EbsC (Cys-tRNA(Pro) deacylase)
VSARPWRNVATRTRRCGWTCPPALRRKRPAALGVAVGQIAKSVIFRRRADEVAVLVVTSGDRRVDEKRVAAHRGPLGRADADFVKSRTGFSIGGVAPVAHIPTPVVLIDRDLFRFAEIWAAAGHPNGVFRLSPDDLVRLTGAPVADVVEAA